MPEDGRDEDGGSRKKAGTPVSGASELNTPLHTEELPAAIECPFCGSRNSEQFSTFGSSLSVTQYYCNACRTVFEAFKWRGPE
jgi:ring-1,2-phenylacetyl-CoA epoxidase subunit PaaD